MTQRIFAVISYVTLFTFAVPVIGEDSTIKSVPNYRQDNYQYHGANKGGDCSGATIENSFVVGNRSGIVIYYDLTAPGFRRVDYRDTPKKVTLWCNFDSEENNYMDFDLDVDEDGIQLRTHRVRPHHYYYFVLEGSKIRLKSKKLKNVVVRGKGDWDYEVE